MPNGLRISRLAGCATLGSVYNNIPTKTSAALTLGRRPSRLHARVGRAYLEGHDIAIN